MNAPTGKRLMLIDIDVVIDAIGALELRAYDCRKAAQKYQAENLPKVADARLQEAERYEEDARELNKAMEESR